MRFAPADPATFSGGESGGKSAAYGEGGGGSGGRVASGHRAANGEGAADPVLKGGRHGRQQGRPPRLLRERSHLHPLSHCYVVRYSLSITLSLLRKQIKIDTIFTLFIFRF